ncbi:hypothetical protein PoB_003093100 [Plakobranchus ocellatus]|uniref:Uncharacterized protein n=1 Tax=Plakobranchus ocellatus TaxID=259542 RepID=A0AAV4ACP0_9GAST|nr:hypothetical protein PoB_003093100 [Plakobranchus ocellatus]
MRKMVVIVFLILLDADADEDHDEDDDETSIPNTFTKIILKMCAMFIDGMLGIYHGEKITPCYRFLLIITALDISTLSGSDKMLIDSQKEGRWCKPRVDRDHMCVCDGLCGAPCATPILRGYLTLIRKSIHSRFEAAAECFLHIVAISLATMPPGFLRPQRPSKPGKWREKRLSEANHSGRDERGHFR